MVQQALALLFTSPDLPLASLIMKKYFKLGDDPVTNETIDLLCLHHAPSVVFQITANIFISQTLDIRDLADGNIRLPPKLQHMHLFLLKGC